jgi:hypothetical protein
MGLDRHQQTRAIVATDLFEPSAVVNSNCDYSLVLSMVQSIRIHSGIVKPTTKPNGCCSAQVYADRTLSTEHSLDYHCSPLWQLSAAREASIIDLRDIDVAMTSLFVI